MVKVCMFVKMDFKVKFDCWSQFQTRRDKLKRLSVYRLYNLKNSFQMECSKTKLLIHIYVTQTGILNYTQASLPAQDMES